MPANNQSLLLSQRNDVFTALQRSDAAPFLALLEWRFDGAWSMLSCAHQQYEYYFHFHKAGNIYRIDYFPGPSLCAVEVQRLPWEKTLEHVPTWAHCIAHQLHQPDYWESSRSLATSIFESTGSPVEGNRRFTAPEADGLRELLNEYRRQLHSRHALSPEQVTEIDEKLNYLATQIDSQARQAWLNTAIGVIVSIAAIIRPEAAVLAGALSIFGSLLAAYRRPKLPPTQNSDIFSNAAR
jgi:hypothetical protein